MIPTAYDLAKAEAMLRGYDARWSDEPLEGLAVEAEFRAPLINPDTTAVSRTWRLGGKIDAIVRDLNTGSVSIVEHKTTTADAGPGSDYIKRLRLDGQVSIYFDGALALGHNVIGCIYDVLVKPAQRPLLATPPENRKYTKDGRLYANQRDTDENPEEYFGRVVEAIAEDPNRFYLRAEVIRLDSEIREAQADHWALGRSLRENHLAGRYPRNPDACVRYGRTCEYFGVCTGEASLDDWQQFKQAEEIHPELSENADENLLTASRLACARRCQREHLFRYIKRVRPVAEAETLSFGRLIHEGLEAWWRAQPDERLAAALAAIRPIEITEPTKQEVGW